MKNNIINLLKNKYTIKIEGKNPKNFIKKLVINNIDLINIKEINKNLVEIKIYKKDYDKVLKLKTIYDINIKDVSGIIKIKKILKLYQIILINLIISLIILYILSNIIFDVEVIHNNKQIRNLIISELKKYDIKKYSFIKSYDEINEIKNKILIDQKDTILWLEIERSGTKYIIKLEEKIKKEKNIDNNINNIISSSDAIIKKISLKSGTIVKTINDYVKKGDIIVSSELLLNDELKGYQSADASVYGEVWYKVSLEYPYKIYDSHLTGKSNKGITITLLNKKIYLFNKYNNIKIDNIKTYQNSIIPLKISYDNYLEKNIINKTYNYEETIKNAVNYSKKHIKNELKEDEYIINTKIINKQKLDSTVKIELFYTVYKEISEKQKLEG